MLDAVAFTFWRSASSSYPYSSEGSGDIQVAKKDSARHIRSHQNVPVVTNIFPFIFLCSKCRLNTCPTAGFANTNELWAAQFPEHALLFHLWLREHQGKGGGDGKIAKTRLTGSLLQDCISQKWLPKQDLNNDDINRHTAQKGEISWGSHT